MLFVLGADNCATVGRKHLTCHIACILGGKKHIARWNLTWLSRPHHGNLWGFTSSADRTRESAASRSVLALRRLPGVLFPQATGTVILSKLQWLPWWNYNQSDSCFLHRRLQMSCWWWSFLFSYTAMHTGSDRKKKTHCSGIWMQAVHGKYPICCTV